MVVLVAEESGAEAPSQAGGARTSGGTKSGPTAHPKRSSIQTDRIIRREDVQLLALQPWQYQGMCMIQPASPCGRILLDPGQSMSRQALSRGPAGMTLSLITDTLS